MTRISAGVRAKELCNAHLNKERVEILRVPNAIKNGKAKVNINKIPESYRLGTGHVTFFYNKLKYLHNRYLELTNECINRGVNISDFEDAFKDLPPNLYNDWKETSEARKITRERVIERVGGMKEKDLKYYDKKVSKEFLIDLLN